MRSVLSGAMRPLPLTVLACTLVIACASTPEEESGQCTTRSGEAGIDIYCGPEPGAEWSDRALEEAEEDMDERRRRTLP